MFYDCKRCYFDVVYFFVDFFDPISVIGESFHADDVGHVGFPELIVVIARWIVLVRQLFIAVNTIKLKVSFLIQIL